ncbi:MAG TPA: DMT family transporter [Casimicrobiaceae bacterium]|nr:DMT family transporter [Casimicrobiaceae bacterium]
MIYTDPINPIDATRSSKALACVALALASLFWAGNYIVGRGLHDAIPPLALTFFRWFVASLLLAPFAIASLYRHRAVLRAHWKKLALLGAVGIGLHNALAYVGLNYTTATNGVILNSTIPVMIIALAWLVTGQRLSRLALFGVGLSLAGVLVILSEGSLATLTSLRLNAGDLLILASMAMWAFYSVLLKWRPAALGDVPFLFVLLVAGDVAVLPFWLAEMAAGHTIRWSPQVFGGILYVALFSGVLAYLFWNRGVRIIGASVAGVFVHLMPVFGLLLAWLVLGERLAPHHLAGIVAIVAGIALTTSATWPKSHKVAIGD